MSSISSIGSGGGNRFDAIQGGRQGGPEKQIEKELTSFLDAKGVSADDQRKIKTELQNAVESSLNGGGKPDFSKIAETFNDVLGKHGIDGSEFSPKLPTPPVGQRGVPGQASGGSTEYDYLQSLLDFLTEQADKASKQQTEKKKDIKPKSESTDALSASEGSSFDVKA